MAAGPALVVARGGDLVWCDAPVPAAGFDERMGCTAVTDPFDVPPIGRHVGRVTDPRSVPRRGGVCTP